MRRLLPAAVAVTLLVPATADSAGKKRNKRIAKKIGDARYVGVRGDGETIDYIVCKSGIYRLRTGNGISTGRKWKVSESTKLKNGFEAIVKDGSTSWAMKRDKGGWQVGYSFGTHAYGDVKRTKATAECQELAAAGD